MPLEKSCGLVGWERYSWKRPAGRSPFSPDVSQPYISSPQYSTLGTRNPHRTLTFVTSLRLNSIQWAPTPTLSSHLTVPAMHARRRILLFLRTCLCSYVSPARPRTVKRLSYQRGAATTPRTRRADRCARTRGSGGSCLGERPRRKKICREWRC
ncbi:hypothetical protein B0H14DRAFT_1372917 [Mycena olivaceomarginata]|nr:hypothetical protein B0H14DRAFT_1372917 [Mycena olivaceomarginata]